MGDNEEHLYFMLFLDTYVQKIRERHMLRNIVNRTFEEILKEFFSDILKDLMRN